MPTALTTLNGITCFAADDSFVEDSDTGFAIFDRELWRTDGTGAGTLLFAAPTGVDADGFSIDPELYKIVVPEPTLMSSLAGVMLITRRRR